MNKIVNDENLKLGIIKEAIRLVKKI